MNGTARFGLPFLSPGQAGKELMHNEALQALDLLCFPIVEEEAQNDPPAGAAIGTCYLVDGAPTGPWAGKAQCVAGYTSGGWRFVQPLQGMSVYVNSSNQFAVYRDGAWELGIIRGERVLVDGAQVVGRRAGAIASPAGGATIDVEARGAIEQMLGALRQHGLIEN